MKANRLITLISVILLTLAATGCGTSRMTFNTLVPPPMSVDSSIETVLIVDRAVPGSDHQRSPLQGEGAETRERAARQHILDGLRYSLGNSGRFVVVRATEEYTGSTTGIEFPDPLSEEIIGILANRYGADAIVALETFSSEFIPTGGSGRLREGSILPEFSARGVATVRCGFRMYSVADRLPVDEFRFSHTNEWRSGGNIISGTINTLAVRAEAINSASNRAGIMYGERIAPKWIAVSREYYRRGGGNRFLAEGARMMQLNDWDRAIEALTRATETGRRRGRGRAAHNLAVVHEIIGDLHTAKEWATVAWGVYREKRSRNYGNILTRRIIAEEELRSESRE